MVSFTKREQIVILIFVVIIVFIVGFSTFYKRDINIISKADEPVYNEDLTVKSREESEEHQQSNNNVQDKEKSKIMVHISGEVHKPGLVMLIDGSRVIDAVELAGGLTQDADIDRINLAKRLVDEEKIYVPKIGEELKEDIKESTMSSSTSSSKLVNDNGKININTANKEELMSLPGIGEALANRILDYRQNNKFKSINDIMNVSGIGEKKFDSIKDLICN